MKENEKEYDLEHCIPESFQYLEMQIGQPLPLKMTPLVVALFVSPMRLSEFVSVLTQGFLS